MDLNDRRNYGVTSGNLEHYKTFHGRGYTDPATNKNDSALIDIDPVRSADAKQYFFKTTNAYLSSISDMTRASLNVAMGGVKSANDIELGPSDLQITTFRDLKTDLKLQSNSCYNFIHSYELELTELEKKASSYSSFISSFDSVLSSLPAVFDKKSAPLASDKAICERIAEVLLEIHDYYLEVYENSVEKQTIYWQKFTEFQSVLAKKTSSASSDSKVEISDLNELKELLQKLLPKSDVRLVSTDFILYPVNVIPGQEDTYATKAKAEEWAKEFGLPESCVIGSGDMYIVVIDTTPVQSILNTSIFSNASVDKWSGTTTEYQAWQTAYNAQCENIKTNTQTLTTKYSTANSTYDTIIKLLSSSIQTLFDCCKEALRF